MSNYRRVYIPGGTVFLTLVTYQRYPIFSKPENVSLFRHAVANIRSEMPFEIIGAVVLPDHIHFIWTLPNDDQNYSKRVGKIKVLFTKSLGVNLEIIGSGPNDNEIKKKITQLNLGKIVKFHGFIKSNYKVNKIIQSAAICYSVWTNSLEDNSSLADPGKPKLYTSLDRPMIISDNVYISKFIKKFNAGIVIKSKKEEIFYSLDKFFRSIKKREEILKNIHIIKKMWDTNKILNKAYLSIR
jgi:REP element-mobilizing transposase RayT